MARQLQAQLLVNDEQDSHGHVLAELLPGTKRLECMAAFAKMSGLGFLLDALKDCLAAGLDARFAIGLDFCLTEPKLLRKLLRLSNKHRLTLYISNSSATFHPKIYALSRGKACTVMIGSANLTRGGFQDNHEASAWIDDPSGMLMQSVSKYVDDLIAQEALVPASKARIDDYERRYTISQVQQTLAKRRIERANIQQGIHMETLRDILLEMKLDTSEDGFTAHQILRRRHYKAAADKIQALASMNELDSEGFLAHYEELLALFHSGGLERGKNIVAENAGKFQAAIAAIVESDQLTPRDAFQLLLDHFRHIPRAGINVLTEILLAIDSTRFAVMNQNAVAGLRLANIHDFPPKPNKQSVNAERYARYCELADTVRKDLGLANFTELDALFNYAYWRHDRSENEDE